MVRATSVLLASRSSLSQVKVWAPFGCRCGNCSPRLRGGARLLRRGRHRAARHDEFGQSLHDIRGPHRFRGERFDPYPAGS